MTSANVIFAIDESGAKGYADQIESYPGEIGVYAGMLVKQEDDTKIRPVFQDIVNRYKTDTGKLHIAELEPDRQENLRKEVFAAVLELNLPCFWYAIHVQGLHDWYMKGKKLRNISEVARETSRQTRIKPSNIHEQPLSMHKELFQGLYGHLIAFLEEQGIRETSVEIRSDHIDKSTLKNFNIIADEFLSDTPYRREHTGWDTEKEKVVKGYIQIDHEIPAMLDINLSVNCLTIKTVDEGSGYIVAADVIANSLYYLFKSRGQSELYKPLNEPAAIKYHPLADNLWPFQQKFNDDLIGDRLYRHPKSQQE